ncbi:MAG: hypothetical protein ACMUIM_11385 [bacterium]
MRLQSGHYNKEKIKSYLVGMIFILLAIGILVTCPHQGKAQTISDYYFSQWGNPTAFSFPSFFPNFAKAGYGSAFPSGSLGIYGMLNPYSPYRPYTPTSTTSPPIPASQMESVMAMEVKDRYAYVVFDDGTFDGPMATNSQKSLRVVDLTDPENPDTVKSIALEYPLSELFLHGDSLFWFTETNLWDQGYNLNEDEYILGVFDISNPVAPTPRDTLKLTIPSDKPFEFSFIGGRLYIIYSKDVGDWGDSVLILVAIDISDLGNLTLLSSAQLDLNDPIQDGTAITDDFLFLSRGDIYIFDVSDPEHPDLVLKLERDGGHFGAHALYGNYLLLTTNYKELQVMNLQDPANPQLAATIELSWPKEIFLVGQRAYISDHCKGLDVVDLSDPENPELLQGYRLPSFKEYQSTHNTSGSWFNDLEIGDGLALTLSHLNVQIWDISEQGNVQMTGRIGPSHKTDDLNELIIPGKMLVLLTQNANALVSLGQDGNIATFGIDSLDALNSEFGIYDINLATSSDVPFIMNSFQDHEDRTYAIEFPESVDAYDIWNAYMDNLHCLVAEFLYKPNPQITGYPASSGGLSAGATFPVGSPFGLGTGIGLFAGATFPGGYTFGLSSGIGDAFSNTYGGYPFQGSNSLHGSYGVLGSGSGFYPSASYDPSRSGLWTSGIINPPVQAPSPTLYPTGGWQFSGQSYPPVSSYPGQINPLYTNINRSIYPIGNYSWSYPTTANLFGLPVNSTYFDIWNLYP